MEFSFNSREPVPFSSPEPSVPLRRWGLGTRKRWLSRQFTWLARFFNWDLHSFHAAFLPKTSTGCFLTKTARLQQRKLKTGLRGIFSNVLHNEAYERYHFTHINRVRRAKCDVIGQKRVRVFHQGFQTPRNRWKHDAEGGVLLLFRGVWNPWWKTKHEFLSWLLKVAWEFFSKNR